MDEFYQISVILSGKLLDFSVEDTTYNKYGTGTGNILVTDGQNFQLFPITAGKELTDKLIAARGTFVEITGAIRNYRHNDEKFNVIRVYSVEEKGENADVNSVQATCEVVGVMTKPSVSSMVKAAQIYLLTNEKYDKHTRLNAVIFGSNNMPLLLDTLPTLGKLYNFKGYLQLDKANQKQVKLNDSEIKCASTGKLELVVTNYEEVVK